MKARKLPASCFITITAVAAAMAGWVGPAAAQERISVHTEPGTPVIAMQLLIATGAAEEDPQRAGIAHLAARSVVRPIRASLDSLEAHLAIAPRKEAIAFTLIAAPDAWHEASRILLVALFRDPVDSVAVLAERETIASELAGRRNNPADAAARAVDAGFFGAEHPWGRPAVGDAASVMRLSPSRVRDHLDEQFRAERAFVAVVGPVTGEAATSHLAEHLDASAPLPRQLIPPRRPEHSPVRADYNSVTTWVTAAYPFPSTTDVEAMRMLAQLVAEELSFGPTRRSVYDMKSEVTVRPEGGELRLTVVVPPDEADAWALRIQETVSGVAGQARVVEGWSGVLRRYRGERLNQLASPESRAAEAVQTLFVTGTAASPIPEFEGLTPSGIGAAGRALGAPTLVLLGPVRDDDSG